MLTVIIVLRCQSCSLSAQQKPDCTVRVTLLQVNDVYQFAPVDQGARGGLARVLTLKKAIEKESPNTLFLLSGDTISPSVESITYKGAQMIDAWNTRPVLTTRPSAIMSLTLVRTCCASE